MRTIIWFIYFWLYLLALIPKMHATTKARKNGDWEKCDELAHREVPKWANSLLKLAGVKVTVHGSENLPSVPCVFVANHESYYDIPIMLTTLGKPFGLMAKKEIMKLPLIRTWMKNLGCVFVDRKDPRAAMQSLNEAEAFVKMGRSMVIFPEGTRAKDGVIGEFKSGSFRIATKAKVPLVPVRI
ncbi:MAG: lysophospholipid acyltransferase family protein, partial [Oscillospiraceae bacterium]